MVDDNNHAVEPEVLCWHKQEMKSYDPAYSHPDWSGADPTATYDVYWFKIAPGTAWSSFGFNYCGELCKIRYRRCNETVTVEAFLPAATPPDDPTPQDDPSLEEEEWYLSLWVGDSELRKDQQNGPSEMVRYKLNQDAVASAEVQYPQDEPIYVGFFTGVVEY